EAVLARSRDDGAYMLMIGIDHGDAPRRDQRLEQAELGREIGFDAWVVIEMIARQIGEGARGNAHAVEPMLVETVRGGFECEMGDALGGKLVERAMQIDWIGRGQRAVDRTRRQNHADGAKARGGMSERS